MKVVRGTRAEQMAALGKQAAPRRRAAKGEVLPAKRVPKPDRSALDQAAMALEKLRGRHAKQLAEIEKQHSELDRRRRELNRRHERQCDEAQERIADERSAYERATGRHQPG